MKKYDLRERRLDCDGLPELDDTDATSIGEDSAPGGFSLLR